jgi:hypothetical protein
MLSTLPQKSLTIGWLQKSQCWCQVCFTTSRMIHGMDYHALFTVMISISTTTAQTSRPQFGLGYESEPPTLASALYLVKTWDIEIYQPPPDQRQQPRQGHPDGHTLKQHRIYPLSTL